MATTEENSIMPSGADSLSVSSCSNNNSASETIQSQKNSWADKVEDFSSNLNRKNVFSYDDESRFFVLKRKEGDFTKTSPFLIQKAIQSAVGEPKSIKKLKSGELLIELQNSLQSKNLKKCTHLANIPITVSTHRTLNSCRGVISESDLQYVTEEELLENLQEQKVTHVKRITIFRNNVKIPTKHIILTFASTKLPRSIKAGYLECPIRPYIPNPLRCFKCQRFGHSKMACRGKLTCGRCSAEGHDSENCTDSYCCVNCKEDHPSYSKKCNKWIIEKEIQTVRTKQNLPYPEARRLVESRTPTAGKSYASMTSEKALPKTYRSIETQTEIAIRNNPELKTAKGNITTPNPKPNQNSKSSQSNSTKPIPQKRTNISTLNTQRIQASRLSAYDKNLGTSSKTSASTVTLPPNKKKKELSNKNKKPVDPPHEETFLTLHPSDSSGNEKMSTVDTESDNDAYI